MRNNILNMTATGGWDEVPLPQKTQMISLQARTAVNMYYRFRGQTTFWTLKSGTVRTLVGQFDPGDLQVQAGAGVIVEVEISTRWTAGLA
jgi:hypothetical protein